MKLVVGRTLHGNFTCFNIYFHILMDLAGQGTFRTVNGDRGVVQSNRNSIGDNDWFATNTRHGDTSILVRA
ncbi:hypothetical protein D3C76_1640910 [compost metagenome]